MILRVEAQRFCVELRALLRCRGAPSLCTYDKRMTQSAHGCFEPFSFWGVDCSCSFICTRTLDRIIKSLQVHADSGLKVGGGSKQRIIIIMIKKKQEWKRSLCILPPEPPHPPEIYPISSPLVSWRFPPPALEQVESQRGEEEEWRGARGAAAGWCFVSV